MPSTLPAPSVLVADDDRMLRTMMRRVLERAGLSVVEAQDGEDALDVLCANPSVNVLVTDLMMPRMNGGELSRRAGELRPGLPVILVTGYEENQARAWLAPPVVRLLLKPFAFPQLVDEVRSLAASHVGCPPPAHQAMRATALASR